MATFPLCGSGSIMSTTPMAHPTAVAAAHSAGVEDPCNGVASSGDCVQVVQSARTVNVPCTKNVCQPVSIPTNTQVTRYRSEPRVSHYTTYETRTRNRVVQQPRHYNETRTVMEQRTITVPKQITVPRTTYVNVPVPENYTVPVQRQKTDYISVPYQVNIPGVKMGRRCAQTTQIISKTIPVYNVTANPAKPCFQGVKTDDGMTVPGSIHGVPTTVMPGTSIATSALPGSYPTGIPTTYPGTTIPGTVDPATGLPTTTLPGTVNPMTGLPTTSLPGTVNPMTGLPTTSLPGTVNPMTGLPTTSLPGIATPMTGLPTTTLPGTTIPGTGYPATSLPGIATPMTGAPMTAPTQIF